MAGNDFDLKVRLGAENNLSRPIEEAGRSLDGLKDKAHGLGASLAGLAATLGIGMGFSELVKSSFEFQSEVEDTKIAVAGLVQTFNNVGGQIPDYTRALQEAEKIHEALRVSALSTAFELGELARAFKTIYAQAQGAGFSTEEVVKFTETLAQVAKAQMLSLDEAAHGMSLVLGGVVRTQGQFGVLMKRMGVTPEVLESWRAAGTTFKEFELRFKAMSDLAPRVAQTWTAAVSNLKDAWRQTLGEGMGSAFEAAKKAVLDFTQSLVKVSDGSFAFNPELLARIKAFSDAIAEVMPAIVDFGKAFMAAFSELGPVLKELAGPTKMLFELFAGALGIVGRLVSDFGGLAAILWVGGKAVDAVFIGFQKFVFVLGSYEKLAKAAAAITKVMSFELGMLGMQAAVAGLAIAGALYYYQKWQLAKEERGAREAELAGWLDLQNKVSALRTKAADAGQVKLLKELGDLGDKIAEATTRGGAVTAEIALRYKELAKAGTDAGLAILEANKAIADPEVLFKLAQGYGKAMSEARAAGMSGFDQKRYQETAAYDLAKEAKEHERAKMKAQEEVEAANKELEEMKKAHVAKMAAIDREQALDIKKNANAIEEAREEARNAALEGSEKELAELRAADSKLWNQYALELDMAENAAKDKERLQGEAWKRLFAGLEANTNKEIAFRRNAARQIEDIITGATVELARLQGDEFGAQMLEAQKKYRDAMKGLGDIKAWVDPAKYKEAAALLEAVFHESTAGIANDSKIQTAAVSGNFAELWAAVGRTTKAGVSAFRANLKTAETALLEFGTTAAQGVQAGLARFLQTLKTLTESVADIVSGALEGLGKALDDSFFALVTGKVKDLGEIFKSFALNLVKMLTGAFSQIAMSWLLTGQLFASNPLKAAVEEGEGGGGFGGLLKLLKGSGGSGGSMYSAPIGPTQTGVPMGNVAGGGLAGVAGLAGLGIAGIGLAGLFGGGTTGQKVGGGLMFAGGLAGAAMGGLFGTAAASLVVPVVGWAIAAVLTIVGAIVSIFSKPPTIKIPVKVGEELARDSSSAISQAILVSYGKAVGGLGKIAKAGGGDVAEITRILRGGEIPDEYLKSQQMTVFGKNQADLDKGYKYLLETALPKTMLSWAFGRQQTGTTGMEGNETQVYSVPTFGGIDFSKGVTPIVAMLQGLDFSNEKIQAIASQIDIRTPDEFVEWLTKWVGAVKQAKDLVADMSRTGAQTIADLEKEAKTPAAVGFKKAMDALADEATAALALVGDDQIAELDRINQEVARKYQEELQFIEAVRQQIAALHDQAEALKTYIDESVMTAEELKAKREATVAGAAAKIAAATTPEEVTAAVNAAHQALRQLIDDLLAQVERARALRKAGASLSELWDKPRFEEPLGVAEKAAKDQANLEKLLADARKHSGQEQLDDIAKIQDAVRQRYDEEVALIATIRASQADLKKSIESQKWEIGFGMAGGEDTDEGRARQKKMIEDRLATITGQIGGAKTPEELRALTDEYQSLISRYIGQFSADSPNRKEAEQKAYDLLDQLQKDANARYAAMEAEATANHEATKKVLDDAQTLLVENEAAAAAALKGFQATIDEIDEAARTKLLGLVDDVVASNAKLIAALDALRIAVAGGATPAPTSPPPGGGETEPEGEAPVNSGKQAPVKLELQVNVSSGVPEEIADEVARNVVDPLRLEMVDLLRRNNYELVKELQRRADLLRAVGA